MKKMSSLNINKIGKDFLCLHHKNISKEIFSFRILFLLFLLYDLPVYSQKQITDNLKCTYIGNSFGGGSKWVQNFIEDMSVTKDGKVYTGSTYDEAHREYGIYTKCDVIGNGNKNSNSLVAVDCKGNTWTVMNPYKRFTKDNVAPVPTGPLAPYILCSDGREIRSVVDPSAICVDNNCRLMVADNGQDQNIKVFDISGTGTPILANTIGIVGGALGGSVPGKTQPLAFWGIRGLGTDSIGNLWVAQCGFPSQVGGGTDLRHYNTSLEMDCQLLDLNFIISMDIDPTDPTQIYSGGEHLEIDYAKPAGDLQAHWKYIAQTLDPFKYPDDPRLNNSLESTFIRYINGKKFMFLVTMYAESLIVYRFEGEIAIPCAYFPVYSDGHWDMYPWKIDKRPGYSGGSLRMFWRDNNGDGHVQKDEFSIFDIGYIYSMGLDIDQQGNISMGGRRLCYFPVNGLDQNGVPNYSVLTMQKTNAPYTINGGDMTRMKYVDETDVMYFGTGSGYPKFNQIVQFKNWKKGERNPKVLNLNLSAQTFTADDKYIYVSGGSKTKYTGTIGEIDIWNAETLDSIGYILPGAEVYGESGLVDLAYALKVSKLPGGERVIIVEEDAKGKNIIYKWCPDGNCVTPDFSVQLTSPQVDKSYMNTGNVVFEASVKPGASAISKVEFYADNVKIGESLTNPYNFTWLNPAVGIYNVYAKATNQNGITNKSNFFSLKITDGKPELFLQSPSANINYTMLDTIVFSSVANDYNGSIKEVEFFRNGASIGVVSTPPYRLNWSNAQAGQYNISAKATDNDGNIVLTPSVVINITNQVSIPFISPVKDTILVEGSSFNVQLNTSAIPNIKSVSYYNGSSVLSTTTTAPYLFTASDLKTGTYNLSALITLSDDRQVNTTGPKLFVIPQVFDNTHTGIMNLDLWTGITGTGITGTNISEIPIGTIPTFSKMTDIFEGPTNYDDNYGERICGYLCPPQTGKYVFWTSGDGYNQLGIKMPDADTLRIIAYANTNTTVRNWNATPSQKSDSILLQKGQMYIIQGLMKEKTGNDNFAVGWQLPDGTLERPISGNRLTPLYNPLTFSTDASIKIISPSDGAVINKNDSITIVAEVLNGLSDISSVDFYSSALKKIGVDKTPESNKFSFKTKLSAGVYKLTVKGKYKQILTVPSNTVNIAVKTNTSSDDVTSDSDFEVYPNPLSTGSLTIKLPEGATQLSVFDITGKLVYKEKVTNNEHIIDQTVFQYKGVYFVNIMTLKGALNRKIIVMK